jgi:hypothetical protein
MLTNAEMFTREVLVDGVIVEMMEDMCTKCRKIILDEYEEDLSDLAFYYVSEDGWDNENY